MSPDWTPHRKRHAAFFALVLAFCTLILLYFKFVTFTDRMGMHIGEVVFVIALCHTYYAPTGLFTLRDTALIYLATQVANMAYAMSTIALGIMPTVTSASGRQTFEPVGPVLVGAVPSRMLSLQLVGPALYELVYRLRANIPLRWRSAPRYAVDMMPQTVTTDQKFARVEVQPANPDAAARSELFPPRPPNLAIPANSISAPVTIITTTINFLIQGVGNGLQIVSSQVAAVLSVVVTVLACLVVVYEQSARRPLPRNSRGYFNFFIHLLMGVQIVVRVVTFVQRSLPAGMANVGIFAAYLVIMTVLTVLIFKFLNFAADTWRGITFLVVFSAADDLVADALFLNSDGYSVFTALMAILLLARLVLRDVGILEAIYDRVKFAIVGDEHARIAAQLPTEQQQEEYRVYRRVLRVRKYWLFASQDMLSEHLSALAIPLFLLLDFALGDPCIIACQFFGDPNALWSAVSLFGVLLLFKLAANQLVLVLSRRNVDHVERLVNAYIQRWGKLPLDSPLRMWSEYLDHSEQDTLSLRDQCDLVSKRHFQRHYLLFLIACCNACFLALAVSPGLSVV